VLVSGAGTYTITHNLGDEYPIVQVYESGSKLQVLPQNIQSIDSNSVQVDFNFDFDGRITIKK